MRCGILRWVACKSIRSINFACKAKVKVHQWIGLRQSLASIQLLERITATFIQNTKGLVATVRWRSFKLIKGSNGLLKLLESVRTWRRWVSWRCWEERLLWVMLSVTIKWIVGFIHHSLWECSWWWRCNGCLLIRCVRWRRGIWIRGEKWWCSAR